MVLTAAALGSLIGLVLAFTGAGGGILAIPALVLGLQLPVQQAGPVGLAAVGMASAVGAGRCLRDHLVRYRAAMLIGVMGMLMAPVGVTLAQYLPNRPLMAAFAGVMCWIAWGILKPAATSSPDCPQIDLPCRVSQTEGRLVWTSRCARALAGTGALSGLLSGMLGVGGGFVIVPALTRHTDLDIRSVQATSLAVIALVSISGVVAAAWHGSMNWSVALPFSGGATASLLIGQGLAGRLNAVYLKQAFACLCVLVALMLLLKAVNIL
jgi:uncharacterized membrane protein YfcA